MQAFLTSKNAKGAKEFKIYKFKRRQKKIDGDIRR